MALKAMDMNSLKAGLLIGIGVISSVVACGSDEDDLDPLGSERADSGGGTDTGGTDTGGTLQGGMPASGGGSPQGGEPPTSLGGFGGDPTEGSGGVIESGPRECPIGSADCDDNHDDCETDTANDSLNCGRCERACGATAACNVGLCDATPILDPSGNSNWCGSAFSSTTAYLLTCWGSFTEIRKTPIEPGSTILGSQIVTYSLPVTFARGMLIDESGVVFGVQGSPSRLYKFPFDADGPEEVVVEYTFENGTRFDGLQLVGDTFYWNNNSHNAAGQIRPGSIRKRAQSGDTSTTLVDALGLNYGLQVMESRMVWLEQRSAMSTLSVYRAAIAGSEVADVEVVTVAVTGAYMTRSGQYAYWTHKAASPNGKIRRLLVDDLDAEPEDVAINLHLPEGLVTDGDYAYFKQLDALYRVPLGGGLPEQLSPAVPAHDGQATAIHHVDDKYVYFAAGAVSGASTEVRVAK